MQFKNIPGQETIKARLRKTVLEQRVSHAQLFLGAEGTHKLAIAIAYAQYINCENRTEEDSCGECPSCIKYQNLAHPDLHFIYPVANKKGSACTSSDFATEWRELLLENNQLITLEEWHQKINIESQRTIINTRDCNNIIQQLSLKSYESEYRVVCIWMVERLYRQAAPKLLKILEEPPEKTLFLLLSENQDLIINTIRSRTQLVKCPPYPVEELRHLLTTQYTLSQERATDVAIRSEGNLKKALSLAKERTDNTHFILFRSLLRGCFVASIEKIHGAINQLAGGNREETCKFLSHAQGIIRDAMLVHHQATELTYRVGEEKEFIEKLAPYIHPGVSEKFYQELDSAIHQITNYGNINLILTDLSFKMSNFLHTPNPNG